MKKLLAMSMILMIAITSMSCSNDSMESTKSEPVQKTSINKTFARSAEGTTKEEQAAIDLIQLDNVGKYVGGTKAYISCHTDYLDFAGHACVYSNGYLFNVSWIYGADGQPGPYYTATQTSFCNC